MLFNRFSKYVIALVDLLLINGIFMFSDWYYGDAWLGNSFAYTTAQNLLWVNVLYYVIFFLKGYVVTHHIIRTDKIIQFSVRQVTLHALLFIGITALIGINTKSARFYIMFYTLFWALEIAFRLLFRSVLKHYRALGKNYRRVLFVGMNDSLSELYKDIKSDPTMGLKYDGYFANTPYGDEDMDLKYLGTEDKAIGYLNEHRADIVYCGLEWSNNTTLKSLALWCDQHMAHLYLLPELKIFGKRKISYQHIGTSAMFVLRDEPLSDFNNQFIKRLFDVVFSGLFLITLFPIIYIVFGIAIKMSSPGPVLFKQLRSGKDDKPFYCYKFRSMKVNVDSDKVQATENDPRKTKIGDFMRRTSIDELPQFINVLKGDMSVVGPRPHMLKHTDEYSKLISNYMVRHLVKPGVTGWAQVTGFRGETKELWQMEGRVEKDVWYIEHWNFFLDLFIIYKTVMNAIHGEENAY